MISKSVLVGEAVLTSILMSLIVENVYGVWLLSWTLTRQALQSLRAMPVYNTRRNTLIWSAVQHVAVVVELASSMPN